MQPNKVEVVGDFLAVRWPDDQESVIALRQLREACPCAGCSGETDVMGQLHTMGPRSALVEQSFVVTNIQGVGSYALQITWADGHDTGIFTFDSLRSWPQ